MSRPLLDRGCQASAAAGINEPPHWSADSKTVFIHVREGGFYHYYAYDLASETLRPVLAPRDVERPVDGWVRQSRTGVCSRSPPRRASGRREVYTFAVDGARRS